MPPYLCVPTCRKENQISDTKHAYLFVLKESEKYRSHAVSQTSLRGIRLMNVLRLFFQLCFLSHCAPIAPRGAFV